MSDNVIDPPHGESINTTEYILIPKSWLVTAIAAISAFLLGSASTYLIFSTAYAQGANDALANAQIALANQQAQPRPTVTPTRLDHVSADDDPFLGPEDAPVTIVEFSDFECPWCAHWHAQTMEALLAKYGDQIRLVYRDYPVSTHPNAAKAAEAAECADEQGKFWELHDAMFENQTVRGVGLAAITEMGSELSLDMEALQECIDSGRYAEEVADDMRDATSYGVTGTPTFFINGVRLVGSAPIDNFAAIIDQELAKP